MTGIVPVLGELKVNLVSLVLVDAPISDLPFDRSSMNPVVLSESLPHMTFASLTDGLHTVPDSSIFADGNLWLGSALR